MAAISRILSTATNYAKRAYKVYGVTVIGDGGKIMENVYKKGMSTKNPFKGQYYKDFWQSTKNAGKELEKYRASELQKHGSTWQSIKNSFKKIPGDFKKGWTQGGKISARKGNKFWLQLKGAFKKGFKGKGPLLGAAFLALFELPNIIKATKNEGVVQGAAETVKGAARIGGFTAGAAIGQVLIPIPIVGTIVGGLIGDWAVSKIVGKSYSERKLEEEQKVETALKQSQQVPFTSNFNPQNLGMYQMMLNNDKFKDDFMANAYFQKTNNNNQQPQINVQA